MIYCWSIGRHKGSSERSGKRFAEEKLCISIQKERNWKELIHRSDETVEKSIIITIYRRYENRSRPPPTTQCCSRAPCPMPDLFSTILRYGCCLFKLALLLHLVEYLPENIILTPISQFTLQGTNTYLLGSGPSRMLIDTGSGKRKWVDTVRTVLNSPSSFNSPAQNPPRISTCLLTHWHHDHLGGVRDLEQLHHDIHPKESIKVYKNQPSWNPDGLIDPSGVEDIADGQKFSVPTSDSSVLEVQAIHTPGHAKDHMVFQITSSPDPSEVGVLFTADNVLGHGTAVFEDLGLYLESLDIMKKRVVDAIAAQQEDSDRRDGVAGGPNSSSQSQQGTDIGGGPNTSTHASSTSAKPSRAKRAYPGHGQFIEDSVAKLDEYMAHRRMREEEALNVLRYGTVTSPNSTGPLIRDSITTTGDSDVSDSEPSSKLNLGGGKELVAGKEWSSMEMVKVIYRHYPENLWEPAEQGLIMVLEKLKKDGKVVNVETGDGGKGRWRASEKATL